MFEQPVHIHRYYLNATFLRMTVDHVNRYYNKSPMHTSQLSEDNFMKDILSRY